MTKEDETTTTTTNDKPTGVSADEEKTKNSLSSSASAADKKADEEEDKAEARIKARKESNELTQRLQKLALERQKVASSGDRLKVIQADASSHLTSAKTFQELNLPQPLLDAIFAMGFDRPSAIQEAALPRILANPPRNLIGQAQSGSGKTAAFTLGMLYRVVVDTPATTQALCISPTRELANQIVEKAVVPMGQNMKGLKVQLAIKDAVLENDKVDAHVVVGTPGKVVSWLKKRSINAKTIKVLVLDEADHMVEEGSHRANSVLIKKVMPKTCQCLLFSATFTDEVIKFASKIVHKPDKILIEDGPEFLVSDVYYPCFVTSLVSCVLSPCLLYIARSWMSSNSCGLTLGLTQDVSSSS
jgi:ATP-dependent RNA helicase DDX19/DBP5